MDVRQKARLLFNSGRIQGLLNTMKIIIRLDRKTGEFDWFMRPDPGPVPPIISPPNPDKTKDTGPPEPEKKPRPS